MPKTKRKKSKRPKAVKADNPTEVSPYAYTIEDTVFGEFSVLTSANAWWMDRSKLNNLINAYKYGCTHEEASVSAGIPLPTLKYFFSLHPDFSSVIAACREVPILKARQSVVTQMQTDGNLAFKYLERKRPEEFGAKMPTVAIQVNLGDRIRETKKEFLAGGSQQITESHGVDNSLSSSV